MHRTNMRIFGDVICRVEICICFIIIERQMEAVCATEAGLKLIEQQYRSGGVNLLVFLDAQRQLNSARSRLAHFQTNAALDLVLLYKALAGGWES